jgi:hypothetical protein
MALQRLFYYSSLFPLPEQVTLWSRIIPVQSERELKKEEKSPGNHFAMAGIRTSHDYELSVFTQDHGSTP